MGDENCDNSTTELFIWLEKKMMCRIWHLTTAILFEMYTPVNKDIHVAALERTQFSNGLLSLTDGLKKSSSSLARSKSLKNTFTLTLLSKSIPS